MRRLFLVLALSLLTITASACSDDDTDGATDAVADTTTADTSTSADTSADTAGVDTQVAQDTNVPDTGTTDTGQADTGTTDTGQADTGQADTGQADTGQADTGQADTSTQCFEFSLDPDWPLAIDGVFDTTTERWRRPHDDPPVCPATAILPDTAADVPLVAYAFCNNDTVAHTFDFEMIAYDGPDGDPALDDPYLILYEGQGIPADALQCLAVNDDIPDAIDATDAEILGVVVPPGGAITMVGTTFTYDPTDGTGTGYYVLIATVADP